MEFELRTEVLGEHNVVSISGDLDVLTAPELRDHLIDLIGQGRNQIVVDLRPTTFLDSSGLSVLVAAVKRARSSGGDISLVCPPSNPRRLIELVSLDQVFKLYDELTAVPPLPPVARP